MSIEEINDFFVERSQMYCNESEETINVICAHIHDKKIDTNIRDFIPFKDFRSNSNISRIRIPAALFISDEVTDSSVYKSLIENYKKKVGAHLIVDSKGRLSYVYTNADNCRNYLSSELRHINAVYPIFINTDSHNKLCLGLRFTTNLNEGFRTYSRSKRLLSPSGGVFDLTEAFLNPNRLQTGLNSNYNRTIIPKDSYTYAIYLCAGTKLIVEDDRFFELTDNDKSNLRTKANNSLFQSGSLVVFTGELVFQTAYSVITDEMGNTFEEIRHITLNEMVNRKRILPEEGLYQHWFVERGLYGAKERVIFLGHHNSVHNAICWRLRINYIKAEHNHPFAILSVPEDGRFVDIQQWDWGIAEIYWRHCYERLFEKVLFQAVSHEQKADFNYYIPTNKGKNTFYWQRKIIGVGAQNSDIFANFNSWRLLFKYDYKDKSSVLIPPFYEQYIDWIETVTPFAPPLHPPIYCNRQFYYLPYNISPEYLENGLVNIMGQMFVIKYKEGVEEYHWSDPQRVSSYRNKFFSTDERLGIDFLVYRRLNSLVGRKILFYLELLSGQNQRITEELTQEWIDRLNHDLTDNKRAKP